MFAFCAEAAEGKEHAEVLQSLTAVYNHAAMQALCVQQHRV